MPREAGSEALRRVEPLRLDVGPDDVDAVELFLGRDLVLVAAIGEALVGDLGHEVLGQVGGYGNGIGLDGLGHAGIGGTATVTVTATDEGGLSATQAFVATVANRPPEAVGTLSTLSLRVLDGAETVEVSGAFRDPDGDDLTYGASSSATAVATVSVSGSGVAVTPVSGGEGDGNGDGDRRGRLEHVSDADVRGDGGEPFTGGGRHAGRADAAGGGRCGDGGGVRRVPGSRRGRLDVRGVVVGDGRGDSVGLGVPGAGDAGIGRHGEGDGYGDRPGRLEHVGDAGVHGDGA